MKKMPCLFERDFSNKGKPVLLPTITPGCEWALTPTAIATRKRDGSSCMFLGNQLYKRYDAKKDRKTGEFRLPPAGAIECGPPDPITGHWTHWIWIGEHDYWHAEAFKRQAGELVDGKTYELCGPKVNGNAEGLDQHVLILHGSEVVEIPAAYFDGHNESALLGCFLETFHGEGIVWHHSDGRMCKLRRDDYGFAWPIGDGVTGSRGHGITGEKT